MDEVEYTIEQLDNQQTQADALGLTMVIPEPNQLQIDLDSKQDELWLRHMIDCANRNGFAVSIDRITESKSGNQHYYLSWPNDLDPVFRVALQACFGSDRKREFLSLVRIIQGIENPTVLYERPE